MVQGIGALRRRFASILPKLERDVLPIAQSGAEKIAAQTRILAPTHEFDLVNSIQVKPLKKNLKGKDFVGFAVKYGNATTKKALRGGRGTINNAVLQEFGTQEMPATPALLPAYRANKSRIRAAISRAAKKALKKS